MDVQSLAREVQALKRNHRRAQRRSFLIAVVAVMIAALSPLATFAANFRDLNPGSPHNNNINLIADNGITTGCNPGIEYCPNGLVTREEMASFLARTAGLGNNPPIVRAKSAQTAEFASTVNGYSANSLVRTTVGGQGNNPIVVGTSYSEATRITITAPGPGYIYLTGTLRAYAASPSNAFVTVVIADPQLQIQSYPQGTTIGTTTGYVAEAAIGTTIVFPVPQGGTRTYLLGVGRDNLSVGTTGANGAILSAIYVPFGPNGASAADIAPAWIPAGDPPSRTQP